MVSEVLRRVDPSGVLDGLSPSLIPRSPPQPKVELCIPAYNEEATISDVVHSGLNQKDVVVTCIHVVANGCTDKTVSVLEDAYGDNPVIRVTNVPWAGKARAWNLLVEHTTSDVVVFLDGDVVIPPSTICNLAAALAADTTLIAVSTVPVPVTAGHRGFDRLLCIPESSSAPTGVCGGCYAVHLPRLKERLAYHGYGAMPEGIIAEDRWLTEIIGPDRWAHAPSAVCFYLLPSLRDYPSNVRRHVLAHRQLRRFPFYDQRHGLDRNVPVMDRVLREWRARPNVIWLARRVLSALLMRLLRLYARLTVSGIPSIWTSPPWHRTPSTKKPIPSAALTRRNARL